MGSQQTNSEKQVIDFVAIRLLNFNRINYTILLEVLENKFDNLNASVLLENTLIKTKIAEVSREHLSLLDKENLIKMQLSNG